MAEAIPLVRRLIFPAPTPPNYDYDSYPDSTIWIPSQPPYADIPCIIIPYRDADALIVFAHGNGCDIGSMYDTLQYYKNHWKVNVLLWEYPGYGSCLGTPSEDGINHNMNRVYEFIRDTLKWPNDRIILFGQSIGTGPTCQLASRLNRSGISLGGVILQSPYTTLRHVVQYLAGSIAAKLIKTNFNNLECMESITDPLFIIHGVQDEIIPLQHSNILHDKSISQRKHLLVVNNATHNHFDHHHDIIAPIMQFIECYLRTPARIPPGPAPSTSIGSRGKEGKRDELRRIVPESIESEGQQAGSKTSTSPADNNIGDNGEVDDDDDISHPPSYFIHHPPSSPMPPSTLKIERKYFTVPPAVIADFEYRLEEERREAESRARQSERKAAVRGFFTGLSTKFQAVTSTIAMKVKNTTQTPTDRASRSNKADNRIEENSAVSVEDETAVIHNLSTHTSHSASAPPVLSASSSSSTTPLSSRVDSYLPPPSPEEILNSSPAASPHPHRDCDRNQSSSNSFYRHDQVNDSESDTEFDHCTGTPSNRGREQERDRERERDQDHADATMEDLADL